MNFLSRLSVDYRQLIVPSIITFVPIPDHFNYTFFGELNYRFKITPRGKNKNKNFDKGIQSIDFSFEISSSCDLIHPIPFWCNNKEKKKKRVWGEKWERYFNTETPLFFLRFKIIWQERILENITIETLLF